MADLTGSAAFSLLPGVDRVIVLLEGQDVQLAIDGADPLPLNLHEPLAFPGDVETHMTMKPLVEGDKVGRDLNLMWDRTRVTGSVKVLADPMLEVRIDAPTAFAVALGGPARVSLADSDDASGEPQVFSLGEQDTLRVYSRQGAVLTVLEGTVYFATIN